MERGKFIVLEGIDGSGKTTQLKRLENALAARGIKCVIQQEPTDGAIGRLIRETLSGDMSVRPETLALLFAADRLEHVTAGIMPLLEQGTSVLCDRFVHSSMAYQSIFMPIERVSEYNRVSMELLKPDLILFLDTPPEECRRRMIKRHEKLELFENMDIAGTVRRNYMRGFEITGERVIVIDGKDSEEAVFHALFDSVLPLIEQWPL